MKKSTFKNGVILVDDNVIYHHFMQKCIERLNLRVPFYFYSTADEIFDHLHMVDIGKYPMPGLILLDIHLRGISGFDI
ncbi:MAG: hypothetical protein KDD61_14735, partial [Bdellovibrionales bacterium]|nr:hypothetical protein [Bdellovibrionales bacterium]